MICFGFLWIFGEKSQKWKTKKSGQSRAPTPQHREPTPRRSPTSQRGMPSPRRGQGAQKGTPWLRYDIALLRRSEVLCRSVAMLRHDIDIVHSEETFRFCSESLVFVHR